MADDAPSLSPSVEDYLKAIYCIGAPDEVVSTSSVAEALQVQPASVTGMVKRLAESGFLEHVPYRGVRLSSTGILEALRILRRHRILETYLTERLGYRWEDVHAEAERLEHAASNELIERMARALGDPSHDPHGAPIPTAGGEIEATDSGTLAEMREGERGQVRAVRDDDSLGLQAAEAAGLLPGVSLQVVRRGPPKGVIRVRVGSSTTPELEIEGDLARRIYVVKPPLAEPAEGPGQGEAGDPGPVGLDASPEASPEESEGAPREDR